MKNSLDAAMQGIEGLINGDGSGMIDQIPAAAVITTGAASSIAGMNVAVAFTDQQQVNFYSTGCVLRAGGPATISYSDGPSNTLFFSTNLANIIGLAVTDFVVVNGATYGAGNSLLGIRAWDVNSNTGTIAGLNRATYPGR